MNNLFKTVQKIANNNHKNQIRLLFNSAKKLQQAQEKVDVNSGPSPLTTLTEDELAMKETVARFAQEQVAPYVREMDNEGRFKDSIVQMLFENGLMGIQVDTDYNGSGCNFMTTILAVEELSKVDPSLGILVDLQNTLGTNVITNYGNAEQKQKYLPQLATNTVCSFALTEPSSGSDAFALKTTAKKDGSDYILNGSKMWISNSDLAGVFLVMANCDPSAGYKGITCFIVERSFPGFSVAPPEKKLGIAASGTCMLTFDNVRVPAANVLGQVGKGYKLAMETLNEGRIGIGAQMIGLAQGCFDATIPYTLERAQFGRPVFAFQGMQHQIAQVATEIQAARLLVYNAARMLDAGQDYTKEGAMAKWFAAEMAQRAAVKCIDWMGGVGFSRDFIQEKFYRDVKIGSIYEGTYNIQLNTIAKIIEKEYKK